VSEENSHVLSEVFAYGDRMVRTAGTIEPPLFRGEDVCRGLEVQNHRDAIARLDEDEVVSTDVIDSIG
jgi:prophage antirepressor-like protein